MFKPILLTILFGFVVFYVEAFCTLRCRRGLILDTEQCRCIAALTTTTVCDLRCPDGSLIDQDNCWCYPDPSFITPSTSCELICPDGMIKDNFNCRCFKESTNSIVFCDIVCPKNRIKDPQLCLCNDLLADTPKASIENKPTLNECDIICDQENLLFDAERCVLATANVKRNKFK